MEGNFFYWTNRNKRLRLSVWTILMPSTGNNLEMSKTSNILPRRWKRLQSIRYSVKIFSLSDLTTNRWHEGNHNLYMHDALKLRVVSYKLFNLWLESQYFFMFLSYDIHKQFYQWHVGIIMNFTNQTDIHLNHQTQRLTST